jgi:hypothetical protein
MTAMPAPSSSLSGSASLSSRHDFDFLVGTWSVRHRRLKRRWIGSDDWDEFAGTSTCRGALGGLVNIDEIEMPSRGFSGLTLRTFDLASGLWSIHWVNSTRGVLEPPVTGRFMAGRGLFEGDDADEGRSIRVRFVWDAITPNSARWQQSFSDGGGTWELNWVMRFTRVAGPPWSRPVAASGSGIERPDVDEI